MPDLVRLAFTDDPRLRGLKSQWMDRMELERAQRRILAEETRRAIDSGITPVKPGSAPGDWRELRGLPLKTRGVRGVMPGTQPGGSKSLERLEKALEARSWRPSSNGHPGSNGNGHRSAA